MSRSLLLLALLVIAAGDAFAQGILRGVVTDGATAETLPGANLVVKGTSTRAVTDIDGRFSLKVEGTGPWTLVVSFVGYTTQEVTVANAEKEVKVKLGTDQVLLKEADVVATRITEKQKLAPLTVETMDVIAIREAASGDFYGSLGTLKGVDMTAASMGFKVINTRGFNSTSPVRSLQLIDGVDNQSPGLNFSLGNFLGCSDLDVMKVDVIAGASTAFYGPGAFNGVINMTSKSPWMFRGLSATAKVGERSLFDAAVRWAEVIKDKQGVERFAYKLNICGMKATDWYAQDYSATSNSPTSTNNPGRYDAVNIYGDENVTVNNNYSSDLFSRINYPGLGTFLRPGYKESDLVNYGTDNLKAGTSLHYKFGDVDSKRGPVEVIAAGNDSRGSTVYQGENRYRLQDVQFWQERVEVRREGKWFLRAYTTGEDAGKTYDIFTTGVRMQEAAGATQDWNVKYYTLWDTWIKPLLNATQPGFYTTQEAPAHGITTQEQYDTYLSNFVGNNNPLFASYHNMVADSIAKLDNTDLNPAYIVGTDRYNEKLDEIRSKRFTEGGSLFFDRSKLAHVMGEHRFKLGVQEGDTSSSSASWGELIVGGNFRQYLPNSAGTIFKDTGNVVIRNNEFGIYSGLEKKLMQDKLKMTLTLRMDKNQNFNYLFSPAASFVYTPNKDRVFRVSFSSAIRNPTLADQYLHYNVGRAVLLGNVDGQFEKGKDSLVTLDSFNAYRTSTTLVEGLNKLSYFNVDRVRPEQVRTIELGYRGTHAEKFYVDASAYSSWYTDFIGYIIGLSAQFDQTNGFPIGGIQAYRLAANATSLVRTQGFNIGGNYYRKHVNYGANYSYNQLVSGAGDPIIPAFNTPQNKFNISITGNDLVAPFTDKRNLGYGINWKYVEGFTFTGSPQFTGPIPSYDMIDAQVNVKFPAQHLMVKLGASNLCGVLPFFDKDVASGDKLDHALNNRVRMVFGGPYVGRLAYLQLIYDFGGK